MSLRCDASRLRGEVCGTEYLRHDADRDGEARGSCRVKVAFRPTSRPEWRDRRPRLQAAKAALFEAPAGGPSVPPCMRCLVRMAELDMLDILQTLWSPRGCRGAFAQSCRRPIRGAARANGRRQDHDAAPCCRSRDTRRRTGVHRWARCHPQAHPGARRCFRVPAVLALSASRSTTIWRSRCAPRPAAAGCPDRPGQAVAAPPSHRGKTAGPSHPALWRPDATRRHRPCARAQPAIYLMDEPLSSLDAKLRADADRAEAHPAGSGRHDPLRHARSDRSHDLGEPGRRAGGRELLQVGTPEDIYADPCSVLLRRGLVRRASTVPRTGSSRNWPPPSTWRTVGGTRRRHQAAHRTCGRKRQVRAAIKRTNNSAGQHLLMPRADRLRTAGRTVVTRRPVAPQLPSFDSKSDVPTLSRRLYFDYDRRLRLSGTHLRSMKPVTNERQTHRAQ